MSRHLWLLLLCGSAAAAEFSLVDRGQPAAAIVLPQSATSTEEYAAAELQGVVNRIAEVLLPIHREGRVPPGLCLVRVGTPATSPDVAARRAELGLAAAHAEPQRYVAKTLGSTLYLVGNSPPGALYATYAFLHKIGCRWYWPGPDGEYLPRRLPKGLQVNLTSAPAFERRGYHLCSIWRHHHAPTETWMARNLMNYVAGAMEELVPQRRRKGFVEFIAGGHVFGHPFRGMFESHPEYFSLIGRERVKGSQPCLSNPEVQTLFVNWVERYWAEHPSCTRLTLFGIDNTQWCEGRCCRAMDDAREPKACVSTRFFTFLNRAIDRLDRRLPDKQYQTIAYSNYLAPPYVQPHRKLIIGYCLYGRCYRHGFADDCEAMKRARQRIEAYQRFGNPMYMYGYHFDLFTGKPKVRMPLAYLLADELRYLKQRSFMGWYTEVVPPTARPGYEPYEDFWTASRFPLYVGSRLLWDPDQKVDAIRVEWCRRVFGRASKPMLAYYRGIEDAWRSAGHFSGILHKPAAYADFISAQQQKQFLLCFADADAALAKERNGAVWSRCRRQITLERNILLSWLRLKNSARTWRATARRAAQPPALDGAPDDPCWRAGPQITAFVDTKGNPVADQTEVSLAYTDQALYLLCVCHDRDMAGLVARQTEHDGKVWADDCIELFIDPKFARGDYYHLAVNAKQARWDARVGVGFHVDSSWDGAWRAAASVRGDHWVVEIELPFATFGPGGAEQPWLLGINRSRGGRKGCPNSSWTDGTYHNPQAFGTILFAP